MIIVQCSFLDSKQCRRCKEWKPFSEFYPAKENRDGIHSYCKSCSKTRAAASRKAATGERRERIRAQNRESYSRHADRRLKHAKEWNRRNPEKVRRVSRVSSLNYIARKQKSAGSFTASEWHALLDRYGHKCLWCGSLHKLCADHVIPLSQGGDNTIGNIQPLCARCNQRKGTRDLDFRS
jgi:5-methylcytosine-specific restriction endonuclease McrA